MNDFDRLLLRDAVGKAAKFQIKPGDCKPIAALVASDELAGVEIELENFEDPNDLEGNLYNMWQLHQEGSLVNGREFVLYPPANGTALSKAIEKFFECKFTYTGGERTSVHIHVNMMDDVTVGNFRAMFALTYLLEGAIYRVADENRKWGGYSCPLIDMDPLRLNRIINAATAPHFKAGLVGQHHEDKYYGFNAVSISKHGTLEFRYFPCTDDKQTLYDWLNMCIEIKKVGLKFASAAELLEAVRTPEQVTEFIREFMPRSAEQLLAYLDPVYAARCAGVMRALIGDKAAADGPSKLPRGAGMNALLVRAAGHVFGYKDPNGDAQVRDERMKQAALIREQEAKAKAEEAAMRRGLIKADGEIDLDLYQALMAKLEARAQRLGAPF